MSVLASIKTRDGCLGHKHPKGFFASEKAGSSCVIKKTGYIFQL